MAAEPLQAKPSQSTGPCSILCPGAATDEDGRRAAGGLSFHLVDQRLPGALRVQNFDTVEITKRINDANHAWRCEHLVEAARPRLARSEVFDVKSSGFVQDQARTSHSAILDRGEAAWLIERAADLLGLEQAQAETPQVARYLPGEYYQPHYDALDETSESGRSELRRGGQRVATLCCYLADLPAGAGGGTTFPQLGHHSVGTLSVKARRGCAVLFFPASMEGIVDRRALHGGSTLKHGEKWISQVWMRQRSWL
eukprot:TRINITY_DN26762_c0_g1_i2.p1 TRINITY_DN26762_c0_g1~~TRINITY_DN26762_c0_g1_i2.p1  ORF type:complete len:269 (-),score=49.93 TRINITY_DN26762_c0_g1_i2:26-787(-)